MKWSQISADRQRVLIGALALIIALAAVVVVAQRSNQAGADVANGDLALDAGFGDLTMNLVTKEDNGTATGGAVIPNADITVTVSGLSTDNGSFWTSDDSGKARVLVSNSECQEFTAIATKDGKTFASDTKIFAVGQIDASACGEGATVFPTSNSETEPIILTLKAQ